MQRVSRFSRVCGGARWVGSPVATRFASKSLATTKEFFDAVQVTVDKISHKLEDVFENEISSEEEYDVESSGDGVISITCGNGGTFVISRQTAAKQLWLSSPLSGPWHYNLVIDKSTIDWKCSKGSMRFWDRIETELSNLLKHEVHF